MDTPKLIPILCTNCGKKIGEAKLQQGIVSIKCKCGVTNIIRTESVKERQ